MTPQAYVDSLRQPQGCPVEFVNNPEPIPVGHHFSGFVVLGWQMQMKHGGWKIAVMKEE